MRLENTSSLAREDIFLLSTISVSLQSSSVAPSQRDLLLGRCKTWKIPPRTHSRTLSTTSIEKYKIKHQISFPVLNRVRLIRTKSLCRTRPGCNYSRPRYSKPHVVSRKVSLVGSYVKSTPVASRCSNYPRCFFHGWIWTTIVQLVGGCVIVCLSL